MSQITVADAPAQSGRAWPLMAVAIVLLNAGNFILDVSFKNRPIAFDMFFSPAFLIAGICLGGSFFVYVRALAHLPLAVAYPVMVGVSLLIVAVIGYVRLGVELSFWQVAGMAAVFAGVTLISHTKKAGREGIIE